MYISHFYHPLKNALPKLYWNQSYYKMFERNRLTRHGVYKLPVKLIHLTDVRFCKESSNTASLKTLTVTGVKRLLVETGKSIACLGVNTFKEIIVVVQSLAPSKTKSLGVTGTECGERCRGQKVSSRNVVPSTSDCTGADVAGGVKSTGFKSNELASETKSTLRRVSKQARFSAKKIAQISVDEAKKIYCIVKQELGAIQANPQFITYKKQATKIYIETKLNMVTTVNTTVAKVKPMLESAPKEEEKKSPEITNNLDAIKTPGVLQTRCERVKEQIRQVEQKVCSVKTEQKVEVKEVKQQ